MSANRATYKDDVVRTHNGIPLSYKKEQNWVICRDVDASRDCHSLLKWYVCPQAYPLLFLLIYKDLHVHIKISTSNRICMLCYYCLLYG